MGNMVKLVKPFVIIGALLWSISGHFMVLGCLEPAYTAAPGDSKELAIAAGNEWINLPFRFLPFWLIAGGVFGAINAIAFFSRPRYEHNIPAPGIRIGQGGPRTLAELSASMQVWPIGFIAMIIIAIFAPPLFQSELVIIRSDLTRGLVGLFCYFIGCIMVMPFSITWIVNHLDENDQY